MLGVPEGLDYLPLVISGALIVLFCIEHLLALWRGQSIEPAGSEMEGSFELWVMCGSFVLLLVLGVPVAFAIGLSSVATVLASGLTRGGRVPEDGRRDAGVLLPRHPSSSSRAS